MAAKKPRRGKSPGRSQGAYRPRVIVKFREHIQLRHDQSAARQIEQRGIGPWQQLAAEFKGISIEPLFASKKRSDILGLVRRAAAADPTYRPRDLSTYYVVKVPVGVDPQALAKALSSWTSVLFAYLEPPPVEPPAVNPVDDPRSPNQGYLDPAPDGIDAEDAWGFLGGDGAGQSLVDLEWGWTFNHEDLAAHGITLISGINHSYFFHGTGVLGELGAVDNAVGCVGIVPALGSVRCVSQWLTGGGYSTSQAIVDATVVMSFGDILLLEAQTLCGVTR